MVNVHDLSTTTVNPYPLSGDSVIFTRGNKLFELSNHLGNVLTTIGDKRYGFPANDSTVAYFNPENKMIMKTYIENKPLQRIFLAVLIVYMIGITIFSTLKYNQFKNELKDFEKRSVFG
jgi:hypothetical protein